MSNDLTLFDAEPHPDPLARLSPDRRRTARQHQQVADGIHPLTQGQARPELGTCGDCAHRRMRGAFPKCHADPARLTHSASTDCRAWWPACGQFEPAAKPVRGATTAPKIVKEQ